MLRKPPPSRREFGTAQVMDTFYGGGRDGGDLSELSSLSGIPNWPPPKSKSNKASPKKKNGGGGGGGWDEAENGRGGGGGGWEGVWDEKKTKKVEERKDEEDEKNDGTFGSHARRTRDARGDGRWNAGGEEGVMARKNAGGEEGVMARKNAGGEEGRMARKNAGGEGGFLDKMEERREQNRERSKSRHRSKSRNRQQKDEDGDEDKQQIGKRKKPEKYMPPKKDEMDLFDPLRMIRRGKHFDEMLTDESQITVLGDGEQKEPDMLIRSFDECPFSVAIKRNIELKKFKVPTQIQKAVIPLVMKTKRDIMGHAQTGSGKMAAYLLPIINRVQKLVAKRGGTVNGSHPYALIMVPTKELAEQIYEEARAFAIGTGVTVFHTFGHMPMGQSMRDKETGCDICIATCGRIQQFVEEDYLLLDQLHYLVMDEADKLLTNDDFLKCVQLIKSHPGIYPKHRCLMFSATFEDGARELALRVLRDDFYFVNVGELNMATDMVIQEFVKVEKAHKTDTLVEYLLGHEHRELIKPPEGEEYWKTKKALVFVERKRHSDLLAIALRQSNINAMSINSDRTLKQRLRAAEDFATGKILVLVATDVAARGLNFPKVETVINVDLPDKDAYERYIHRIGRTGRLGNIGHAISYFDPNDPKDLKNVKEYVKILESAWTSHHEVPEFLREALAEQLGSGLKQKKDEEEDAEEEEEDDEVDAPGPAW